MSSNESAAYKIMRSLDVDYVLVIFGGVIGYSGDDINKFLWMVRIAEGEHPKDIRVRRLYLLISLHSLLYRSRWNCTARVLGLSRIFAVWSNVMWPSDWLERLVSEMTCYVSRGTQQILKVEGSIKASLKAVAKWGHENERRGLLNLISGDWLLHTTRRVPCGRCRFADATQLPHVQTELLQIRRTSGQTQRC